MAFFLQYFSNSCSPRFLDLLLSWYVCDPLIVAPLLGRDGALLVKGVGIAPTDAELIWGLHTAHY